MDNSRMSLRELFIFLGGMNLMGALLMVRTSIFCTCVSIACFVIALWAMPSRTNKTC